MIIEFISVGFFIGVFWVFKFVFFVLDYVRFYVFFLLKNFVEKIFIYNSYELYNIKVILYICFFLRGRENYKVE